jgi:hypothetical protein
MVVLPAIQAHTFFSGFTRGVQEMSAIAINNNTYFIYAKFDKNTYFAAITNLNVCKLFWKTMENGYPVMFVKNS